MRRIQHQRKPFGPKRPIDRHPSLVVATRRIRLAKVGPYLKTWGSRPDGTH